MIIGRSIIMKNVLNQSLTVTNYSYLKSLPQQTEVKVSKRISGM